MSERLDGAGESAWPTYSIVVPVLDEEESLPELGRRLRATLDVLDGPTEVILVDDGSRDRSHALMLELATLDPRFKVVRLSRNFGHEFAITAGTDLARGEAVIVMDADLQDPPELIPQLIERWREGFEVVYAVRERREGESWLKKKTASLFYWVLRKTAPVEMPPSAGDFRLVDRKAADVFAAMREQTRYVRGMIAWIGFRQTGVAYARPARFAGHTKYPFSKMLRLAADALLSFSDVPLLAVLRLGLFVAAASMLYGVTSIALKLGGAFVVPGWASIVAVVTFVGGIQLVVLGAIGVYVARVFQEVKNRPLYVIRDVHGFEQPPSERQPTSALEPSRADADGG
jgi:dolichol-phosphate mannosyltransferase